DLISGLLHEQEATVKMKQYQIAISSKALIVVKLRIDQFTAIRKKYIEKDEQLLRFSIINILEEIIPRRWKKEVVIETSSEYLLIANAFDQQDVNMRSEITKLCSYVQQTLKDFMNLSISIGVSSLHPNVLCMRKAYQEADKGLRY